MIHAKKPNIINPRKIFDCKDKNLNANQLIDLLEKEFKVPHVINAEVLTDDEPDEKAMMTFLSYAIQGLEKFPTVAFGLSEETQIDVAIKFDTIPSRIFELGNEKATKEAYFVKSENTWKAFTWKECADQVESVARSLIAEGIKKGDKVAIIGRTSPSWSLFYLGSQAIGCVPVGINENYPISATKNILEHSESKLICVEGEENLKKVTELQSTLPNLKKVILFKRTGEKGNNGTNIISWNQFLKNGESVEPKKVKEILDKLEESDEAVYVYTAGK